MPYDLSDSVPIAVDVRDANGTLTNATTAVLTITLPDGTTTTPSVTNPPSSTGQYRVTYLTTQVGRHSWRFVTTVPNTAYQDVFEVRETVSPALLSLADAKTHLNITTTTNDDELREFLEAATEVVESYVGPIVRRTHTAKVTGGQVAVPLPHTQVLTVVSVNYVRDDTEAVAVADVAVNTDAGVITRLDGSYLPYGELEVEYTVGRDYVKPNWTLAAKMIVQNNWRSQTGNLPSIQGNDEGDADTGSGFLVPYKALALLRPDEIPVGFA